MNYSIRYGNCQTRPSILSLPHWEDEPPTRDEIMDETYKDGERPTRDDIQNRLAEIYRDEAIDRMRAELSSEELAEITETDIKDWALCIAKEAGQIW